MGHGHSHHHGEEHDFNVETPTEEWDKEAKDYARMSRGFSKKTAAGLTSAEWWKPGLDVLDFGCGPGQVLLNIAKDCAHVTGLDISPGMLELFQKQIQTMGIQEKATSEVLVERDGSELEGRAHDVVICAFVLHHCKEENRDGIVRRLCGAVKPGGRLVIVDFAPNQKLFGDMETVSEEVLKGWFTKNGCEDIEFKYYWERMGWFTRVKAVMAIGARK